VDSLKRIIESTEQDFPQELEKIIAEKIVEALAELGVDTQTNDPKVFERSLKESGVRWDNLMYPEEPAKSGLYFYRGALLAKFVHIPRTEGIDMTNFMGDSL
jgi:hypothetical protein